jgi:oxygen-independent coproporphyrinogen-3 oxidase
LCELTPVNRLSIGIQSFHDNDLAMLNRRHTAEQAKQCVVNARQAGYQNISLDLIYGLPGMSKDNWLTNLQIAFGLGVQHISAYHLTVEPQTSLFRKVNRGLLQLPAEEESRDQFFVMHTLAAEHEFLHYEISNLAKQGYISKHNTNYWRRKKYLGLGPSAHSFNLVSRQWNVSHVVKYIEALINGHPYFVSEELDDKTRFNEHLMLSLRTCWGVGISEIRQEYGERMASAFESQLESLLQTDWIVRRGDTIILTPSGWMVSDYIVSRLLL